MKNYNTHVPRPKHYLSVPSTGGIWKNKETGNLMEIIGSNATVVLLRKVYGPAEQTPQKIESIEEFYATFSHVGHAQNAANVAQQ